MAPSPHLLLSQGLLSRCLQGAALPWQNRPPKAAGSCLPARCCVAERLRQDMCCAGSAEQVSTSDVRSQGTDIPHWLNSVPHSREQRQFFYREATEAVSRAIQAGERRVQVQCTIPELNSQVDVFRIGTLLELVRELAQALALDGKRVKISVQQAMGQGVFQGIPLSLSGVRKIMERMDWGEVEDFVTFGQVGADQIDDCDYYLLIRPQNIAGNTIMTHLHEMVDAAEAAGKAVIIVNPSLTDVPSSAGVMGVRGRGERTAFAQSFHQIYHFRLLFWSSAQLFPIMGACRRSFPGPWEVYKRVSLGKKAEAYRLVQTFDKQPTSKQLTPLFADD